MSNALGPAPITLQPLYLLTVRAAMPLILLIVLSGCISISSAPFSSLSTSIQQLRDGADASLSNIHDRTRDNYIAEAASGNIDENIAALLLDKQPDNELFGWVSPNPPPFFQIVQFREGVYLLNSVFIDYANLLGQLASPDLIDPKTFEELAKNLNNSVRTAAQVFPNPPDKEIAIFSTLSTAAFRAYLQNRQRSSLIEALKANQPAVTETANLGAMAVRIATQLLRSEYDKASARLVRELKLSDAASAIMQPAPSKLQKEAVFRELVVLDEKYIKELFILNALHRSYIALPSAHKELTIGLENPKATLSTIQEISENGRQLYRLYEELRKNSAEKNSIDTAS